MTEEAKTTESGSEGTGVENTGATTETSQATQPERRVFSKALLLRIRHI